MNIDGWINQCFSRLEISQDCLAAYRRFMLQRIAEYPEEYRLDFHQCYDSLTEPDDTDSWTHAEYLEFNAKQFIKYFNASIKDGHLEDYAQAYANLFLEDNYELRVSSLAYEAIGALNQPWTPENPGYKDVIHACLAKGKDKDFAHRCAKILPDYDYFFKSAFEAIVKYDTHFAKAVSNGRSVIFAGFYAKAWSSFAQVEVVALNYADCSEKLLEAGRNPDETSQIAYQYATKHLECYFDDEENHDFEHEKYEALAKAESAYRFRCLTAEEKKLPDLFLQICRLKYPTYYEKQWFDEIEILARSVLVGNLTLKDIKPSDYIEFLEQTVVAVEPEKPPRFDLMSEDEFKKFRPKSEAEQGLWEAEVKFRKECRYVCLDPTDPHDRNEWQGTLDEYRDTR